MSSGLTTGLPEMIMYFEMSCTNGTIQLNRDCDFYMGNTQGQYSNRANEVPKLKFSLIPFHVNHF